MAHTVVPVCKGVDQLELIMKHTAVDQYLQVAIFRPVQSHVNLISAFDFCNIFRRSQDMFSVEDRRYLFQAEGILFNGEEAVDGANIIAPA